MPSVVKNCWLGPTVSELQRTIYDVFIFLTRSEPFGLILLIGEYTPGTTAWAFIYSFGGLSNSLAEASKSAGVESSPARSSGTMLRPDCFFDVEEFSLGDFTTARAESGCGGPSFSFSMMAGALLPQQKTEPFLALNFLESSISAA